MSENYFKASVLYLRYVSVLFAAVCAMSMYFGGFDPWHSLDSLVWHELYGQPQLPEVAKPVFRLMFLLFNWLSILCMLLYYLVATYALVKKERWAFFAFLLVAVFWPSSALLIAIYTSVWSYFLSVALMAILFLPPLLLILPQFLSKKIKLKKQSFKY